MGNAGAGAEILVTAPGKLGDLIYSLPAVKALAAHYKRPVTFQTSEYCASLAPLLNEQTCIKSVIIDPAYKLEHTRFGCQPWRMSEPTGFGRIFHLGFRRELLDNDLFSRRLTESFFVILKKAYNLDLSKLSNDESPYLELPEYHYTSIPSEPYISFQAYGRTLFDLMDEKSKSRLFAFFMEIFELLNMEIVALTVPEEDHYYSSAPVRTIHPEDLLETAVIIQRSKLFIGVQSIGAAIADGLKSPRLIFNWFRNATPSGPGGLSFFLDADPHEVARAIKIYYNLK